MSKYGVQSYFLKREVFGYDVKVGLFKMQEKLKSFYSIITQVISINWYRGEFLKFRDKIRFYHLSCPNWGKLVFPELVIMQAW